MSASHRNDLRKLFIHFAPLTETLNPKYAHVIR